MTLQHTPQIAPGRGTAWRPLTRAEVLDDLTRGTFPSGLAKFVGADRELIVLGGGPVPGVLRCAAVGLERGDCRMHHIAGSRYCYYHSKLMVGLCEPDAHSSVYPVWPLPASGYALLTAEAAA